MDETCKKRQLDFSAFVEEKERHYQAKYQKQIQAMRDDFEARFTQNRIEIGDFYENKLSEASQAAHNDLNTVRYDYEKSSLYKARAQMLGNTIKENEATIDCLERKITDLDAELRQLADTGEIQFKLREDQIGELQKELSQMVVDYQDLLDVKVQLDSELQTYFKLLEGEENRYTLYFIEVKKRLDGSGDTGTAAGNRITDKYDYLIIRQSEKYDY